MFSEIPDDSKTNNNDEELNNVLLYTQQFLNDEENKNKKKSKKKSKKKKTIKNQDPEKILRSIEKKIKSDKSNYDNVNSLLVFTRSLLNKYEKYKIKAKVDCDNEIKRKELEDYGKIINFIIEIQNIMKI